jgi:hypothetical protein
MKYSDKFIQIFIENISKSLSIKMQDIETIWNSTKENNPIEYTPYITFVKEQRPLIKKQNPSMSFGEISKEVGKLWKIEKDKQPPKTKPYLDFVKTEGAMIRKENPKLTFSEVSKELGKRWNKKKNPKKLEPINLLENIKEYEMTTKEGDTVKVPLVATPWLVTKAIQENFDEKEIIYCEPTPPPSPGPDQDIEDEDEKIPDAVWTRWNDFCKHHYERFFKDKPLDYLVKACRGNMLPVGPRNKMIMDIVEDKWYSDHQYKQKKYGLNTDKDVYEYRLQFCRDDAQKKHMAEVYEYLKWPPIVRQPWKDRRIV